MKRALIVKLGAIGDVIMAVSAVAQLRQQGYAIDWVCGPAVADLLRSYSWINVLIADDEALLHGSFLSRLRSLTSLWARLRGTPYQLAATLYYDRRWRLLTLPVRAERTIVLSHTDRRRRVLPGRHHTAEFARILLNLPDNCRESSLTPLSPDRLPISPLPPPRATRIALVPAGASNLLREQTLRRWPADRYAAVAATLLQRGWEVVLLGGPGDAWVREDLAPVLGHPGLIDCIGGTTLPQFVSIANSCNLVLSHDTGPLHLGALSHAPILALFGPTDPGSFLPRREGVRVLWGGEQLACRPCYDGRDFAPCTSNGCMQSIATELVLHTIDSMLSDSVPHLATLVEISPVTLRPGLFLDRDGVINEEVHYLWRAEDCRLIPGIAELIRTANDLGYVTCVVTNQAGIGRGYYTEDDFHRLMSHIGNELRRLGARIDAVYFSPFHPEHGIGEYRRESDCRKPAPGMVLRAASEHAIDLSRSVMVGDRCSDLQAGRAAGIPELYLFGLTEPEPCEEGLTYLTVSQLSSVQQRLLKRKPADTR